MSKITGIQIIELLKKIDRQIKKAEKAIAQNLQVYEDEKASVEGKNVENEIEIYNDLINTRSDVEVIQEKLNVCVMIHFKNDQGIVECEMSLARGIKQLSVFDRTLKVLKEVSTKDVHSLNILRQANIYSQQFKVIDPNVKTVKLINTFDPEKIEKMIDAIEDAKSSLKSAISHGNNVPIEFSEDIFNKYFKE